MGLDITALRKATYVGRDGDGDEMYEKGYHYAWINTDFPGHADGRETGYYSAEDSLSFRAGSYSGYNHWRNQLAHMAHGVQADTIWRRPQDYMTKPFFGLINFADNEGIIGPATAKRLAEAFAQYNDKARAYDDGEFYTLYQYWHVAFLAAADDGLVIFH